tara:strand:+ start:19667 stop:20908 length:1242 start_codon:yes stop_codon:yes gene_type:complete
MNKFIIVTRLFSGLIDSVVNEEWKPTGIPAIYKLIEGCNKYNLKIDVVFICKKEIESAEIPRIKRFVIKDKMVSKVNFHVIPYKVILTNKNINRLINSLLGYCYVLKLYKINRYKLLYCDRVNVVLGFLIIKCFRGKVFLRLLGFYPDMKNLFDNPRQKYRNPILFLAYKSKFSKIICTQDDSGGLYYLKKYFKKRPYSLLLNGVDHQNSTKLQIEYYKNKLGITHECPILLFVGKLEKQKGCLTFLKVMNKLNSIGIDFYAIIVGSGSMLKQLEDYINNYDLGEKVKLVGPVDNADIFHYYNVSDIYIHLYIWASLTNTMLEALSAGNAIALISKLGENHVGTYAEKIIPQCIKFDRNDVVNDLKTKLSEILPNKQKIELLKKSSNLIAKRTLSTWDKRIDKEIYLITRYLN